MKALMCGKCTDIRALDPEGTWTHCRCGNTSARWVDPKRGTVVVKASVRKFARILGLHNSFLATAFEAPCALTEDADWQTAHEAVTHAPGYIFDKSKRGCWACIVQVGQTGDICWEEEKEPEVGRETDG